MRFRAGIMDGDSESSVKFTLCCCSCLELETVRRIGLGEIYLGDHLTRQWNRPIGTVPIGSPPISGQIPGSFRENDSTRPRSSGKASIRRPSRRKKIKNAKEILSTYNITNEDIQIWNSSFDALLKSECGVSVFKNFLESEFAEENLKFWLACEDLKTSNKQTKKLERRIQDIYYTYIDTHSSSEVNIDYKMRENIVDQLKTNDASIFTEAQHQIYSLMYRDSYPRFLSSVFVVELIEEVNDREKQRRENSKSTHQSSHPYFSCCIKRQDINRCDDESASYSRNETFKNQCTENQVNQNESNLHQGSCRNAASSTVEGSSSLCVELAINGDLKVISAPKDLSTSTIVETNLKD